MRLKYQLFLLLLLTGGLLIALMATIGSWSFSRGFIGYINDTERQRLVPLIDTLAEGYAREGDWRWITDDRDAWGSLVDEHLELGRRRPPPSGTEGGRSNRPADPASGPRPMSPSDDPDPPPRRSGGRDTALTLDPRLLLADAERRVLIGHERDERHVRWQPIAVAERTVGYLGYRERVRLSGRLDQAFAAQQRRGFLYAALAMVLLSAALAVLLAGRLVRPLLAVNDAVARIGRGQYAHRVPVTRRDEIGDLARSIDTLAATLEKNLGARRQWLAEISHELRTPVAILQGELEAIQDGVVHLDDEAVASLHAETLRLARLIDDLHALTLSDVGALDYRFEPLDLRELVATRIAAARGLAEAAGIAVRVVPRESPVAPLRGSSPSESPPPPSSADDPLPVDGDAHRLGQLVDNLLQNSIRYTDPAGEIRVTMWRAGEHAAIDWSDSAPGVDDAQLDRLFEPLYRADASRNRGYGGAGLGLAIVQRIVEAHRGTIAASHSPSGGLALRIDVPLSPESTA